MLSAISSSVFAVAMIHMAFSKKQDEIISLFSDAGTRCHSIGKIYDETDTFAFPTGRRLSSNFVFAESMQSSRSYEALWGLIENFVIFFPLCGLGNREQFSLSCSFSVNRTLIRCLSWSRGAIHTQSEAWQQLTNVIQLIWKFQLTAKLHNEWTHNCGRTSRIQKTKNYSWLKGTHIAERLY